MFRCHVELDPIEDRVVADRSRMSRPFAERLSIRFTRSTHVCRADRVEGDQVEQVDLNAGAADGIYAADPHLWPLPKAKRDGDLACDHFVA